MNPNLTHITVVLDRSGSMHGVKEDTVGGFATFVAGQKQAPGECRMSLLQFDNEYETVFHNKPVAEVGPLELFPRGGTALYDALGRAIDDLGKDLSNTPEDQRPAKVVVVVITDGQENSSTEITHEALKAKIEHQQSKYNWQFVYIGADVNTVQHAVNLGIHSGGILRNALNVQGLSATYASLSSNVASYRSGSMQNVSFSAADAAAAMGTVGTSAP